MSTSGDDVNTTAHSESENRGAVAPALMIRLSGSGNYYSHYASGWCHSCGRKRGGDGRCSECDGWWTLAVIQYGAPMVFVTTMSLVLLLPLLRPRTFVVASSGTGLKASATRSAGKPMVSESVRATVGSLPRRIPVFVMPPAPVLPPPTPSPDAVRMADAVRLRAITGYASAVAGREEAIQAFNVARSPGPTTFVPGAGIRIPTFTTGLPVSSNSVSR